MREEWAEDRRKKENDQVGRVHEEEVSNAIK